MDEETDVIMQPRCTRCLAEQYGPVVWEYSHGRASCHRCGVVPTVLHDVAEYQRRIVMRRAEQAGRNGGADDAA